MSLWKILRARPGALVRDPIGSDWVKGDDKRWRLVGTTWWPKARAQTSFRLWFHFGPLKETT